MFRPTAPGPKAARIAEIMRQRAFCADAAKVEALGKEMQQILSSVWDEPVPEEDAEWTWQKRREHGQSLRGDTGIWAYHGYRDSNGGLVDGKPDPWDQLDHEPWYEFGDRVRKAPEDEPEQETLEAALAAYAKAAGVPPPSPSEHWLAAVRHIRAKIKNSRFGRTPGSAAW